MPNGNRMGPMGKGPMTGRGAGYCGGAEQPGYMNPAPGMGGGQRGMGGGQGGGRGRRCRFLATGLPGWMRFGGVGAAPVATPGPVLERQFLERQTEVLQEQLDVLKKQLEAYQQSAPDQ